MLALGKMMTLVDELGIIVALGAASYLVWKRGGPAWQAALPFGVTLVAALAIFVMLPSVSASVLYYKLWASFDPVALIVIPVTLLYLAVVADRPKFKEPSNAHS